MRKRILDEIVSAGVRHNPQIAKRVMIESGEVPGLTNFSRAVLEGGQVAEGHRHDDMWEVFFVAEGRGQILVDGVEHELPPGTCLVVEPGEWHELCNPHRKRLVVLYFGLR